MVKIKITAWRLVHWFIIANFALEIAYCGFQVFFVLGGGPLFGAAVGMDMDLFLKRRLYAIETWIGIVGLCVYLAITEIRPRQKKEMEANRA